eukprot:TRINITY_DN3929_c2_g1_i1.p1 TRINITY_DN3929_c2_g1~~TRINITY_DN3929_c2_g1_i1.p1  ORF type:complete len:210 (+),score=83.28 TRINITY_DN3929_c2_g1_i1:172-801(+)
MSHGHGHNCAHEAEEGDVAGVDRGESQSLLGHIHLDLVTCLNESETGAIRRVFKPFDQRMDRELFVESDADEQLLVHIPFTGQVKVKSICVGGGPEGTHPSRMKVWVNKEHMDFEAAEGSEPTQEWELAEDFDCLIHYPTKLFKFQNVSSLTLFFPENFGADTSIIYYIALTGEFLPFKREAVTAVYEARALPSDHKTKSDVAGSHHVQ